MKQIFSNKKAPDNYVLYNNKKMKFNIKQDSLFFDEIISYFGDGFYMLRDIEPIMLADNYTSFTIGDFKLYKTKKDEILMDNYLLNLKTNDLKNLSVEGIPFDSFMKAFNEETKNTKLKLRRNLDGTKSILSNGKEVVKLRNSAIEKINFNKVNKIDDFFLPLNKNLKKINLPNVKSIGEYFLLRNKTINQKQIEILNHHLSNKR